MTTDAGPAPHPLPNPLSRHRRKTSICAANAHNLLPMPGSDDISTLNLSPTTSTLSGASEAGHYLPRSAVSRRGTITSLHSSSASTTGGAGSDGTVHPVANGHAPPNGSHHPQLLPNAGHERERSLHRIRAEPSSSPSPASPVSVLSANPPPSYHSPEQLPKVKKQVSERSLLPTPIAFASLMLLGNDRIRITGFPDSCQELMRHVLSNGWNGVEGKRSPEEGVFEWKLAKTPWMADAPLASYRLIEYILFSLSKEGWSLALAAGMRGQHNTRDVFFFQPAPRRERRYFSILFGTHMVTLLDAPDQRVCEAFVQAIGTWPAGAGSLYSREHGAFSINMKQLGSKGETAWPTSGGKHEHALPQLMCTVLQHMLLIGYECVTTYDILDRKGGWHWNDAKGIMNGAMPAIDVWVFADVVK